jgi:hypothetical protein
LSKRKTLQQPLTGGPLARIIREGAESSYFSGKICRKMITAAFQAQPVA